jgi:hypothetical protein
MSHEFPILNRTCERLVCADYVNLMDEHIKIIQKRVRIFSSC